MMMNPPIDELTEGGKYSRYEMVIAAAKAAKIINDEYVENCERAEQCGMKKEIRDEKFLRTAIDMIYNKEFKIVESEQSDK